MKKNNKVKVEDSYNVDSKGKRSIQQYKCGDASCGKVYHSYTAFYNHCKKSHGGEFPANSLQNGEKFEGPTKNRGRPRIKKNQVKDLVQIESMKKENQLIEFMGTLDRKKSEELIVYVEDPIKRIQAAVVQVKQWLRKFSPGSQPLKQQDTKYLNDLQQFNQTISDNDLPEFYDPIETHLYPNKLDSYSFSSVENFMNRPDMRTLFNIKYQGKELLYKIYLCWSARMLSQTLFNEVLYLVMQFQKSTADSKQIPPPNQREFLKLLFEKKNKLKELLNSFFDCLLKQHGKKTANGNETEQKRQFQQVSYAQKQTPKRKNPVADRRYASDEGNQQQDDDDGQEYEDENQDDN